MKNNHVACAIVEHDGLSRAVQRSDAMSFPLKWEFPGGKIDPGESPEDCLKRELMGEMSVEIVLGQPLPPVTHQYPTFIVTRYPFPCSIASGEITRHEHSAITGQPPEGLPRWPADVSHPL